MKNSSFTSVFEMPQPETELSALCIEVEQIAKRDPKILELIVADQDKHAKEEKKNRILDRQWRESKLTPLPGMDPGSEIQIEAEELTLKQGRKRMTPQIVLFFLVFRGYIGGFKAKATQTLVKESMTIHNFLEQNGVRMPGWSTIIDNVNQVCNQTHSYILNSQLAGILGEKLDDLAELTIDSTSVSANTCWPTDSGILLQLVERIWRLGQKLDKFGIDNIAPRRFAYIIKLLKQYHKTICMSAGKKNSREKIKTIYRNALKESKSALNAFEKEMVKVNRAVACTDTEPTKLLQLSRMVEIMNADVENLARVISYCTDRIEHEKTVKSNEKIMSYSDKDAAYIQKGQREAVIGYKPQVGRSKKGFITCINVPEGNAADSGQLEPMVDQHIERTGIVPGIVSADDGYASADIKQRVEEKGVGIVSISGAKGKKITPEKDWESDLFRDVRNNRSSVESLMFTIKHNHHFGRVMRRGIAAVRAELLEKVLAYNFFRAIEIRILSKESEDPVSDPKQRLLAA
ncbi:MAG: transposase [Desulfobacteraceae bacterium]|nr:transposase [Desulfobacteraceae bacterium]